MNRSNVGNVITNGMQILSVGGTTASRVFKDKADSALNNLSPDERKSYFEMKADKMRDETKKYNSEGFSPDQHMTEDELHDYQKAVAENRKKYTEKTFNSKNESVDDLMEYTNVLRNVGEQGENIAMRIDRDVSWYKDLYKERSEPLEDIIKEVLEGEEKNANV